MLNLEPENLRDEIEAAEALRHKHTQVIEQLVLGYCGDYFRSDRSPDEPTPENHAFEYVSLMLPLLAYDNPAVAAESTNASTDPNIAIGTEEALNQWVLQQDLQTRFERVGLDCLFGYGVLLTTLEEVNPDDDDGEYPTLKLPRVNYLAPDRFFLDHRAVCPTLNADGFDGIRLMGHRVVRDKNSMLKDKRFDHAAIESLEEDVAVDELKRPDTNSNPTRNEIVFYEVWVPPNCYNPNAKYNGMIYTLAVKQDATKKAKGKSVYIRKPRPFFGPPWGPYTMFGIYGVPGSCYPLGPIPAVAAQAEELNAHADAASRAAGREKSITLVNSTENAAAAAVKNAKDGEVWKVPNLTTNSVVQLEVGGVPPQRYEYLGQLRERLDRNSGINDARRGNITDKNTLATAIDTANAANADRNAFIKSKFQKAAAQVVRSAAWYFIMSEDVVMELGPEAAKRLNMQQPVFHGGIHEGQEGYNIDALAIRIEPMSMERPNEAMLQQRTMTLMEWLLELAKVMPGLPYLAFDQILELVGRVFSMRSLTRMVNLQLLQQMWQAQANAKPQTAKPPSESLNYKDAPEDVKRQIEEQAGLQPSQSPMNVEQHLKAGDQQLDAQAHRLKAADIAAKMQTSAAKAQQQPAMAGAA